MCAFYKIHQAVELFNVKTLFLRLKSEWKVINIINTNFGLKFS